MLASQRRGAFNRDPQAGNADRVMSEFDFDMYIGNKFQWRWVDVASWAHTAFVPVAGAIFYGCNGKLSRVPSMLIFMRS